MSVGCGPLPVVYDARRQWPEIEVSHQVGTHKHRAPLFPHHLDHLSNHIVGTVDVVAVQLYGIASAGGVAQGLVPASAYAQVFPSRLYQHQPRILYGTEEFSGSVVGMVVHHYHVEREVRLLGQGASHGIPHGPDAVADRNDHRGFILPYSPVFTDPCRPFGQPGADT